MERLTINGQRIIHKLVPQAGTQSVRLHRPGRRAEIQLHNEYFDRFGGALAMLQWAGPGISKQVVPQSAFNPS